MFHLMKSMVMSAVMFGLVFGQSPIIRVKQIGSWDSPQTWWKDSVTQNLDTFLAQDTSKPAEDNNNFDIWRDKVLEMEVTLDDVGEDITTLRFDIAFDNDLITWVESHQSTLGVKEIPKLLKVVIYQVGPKVMNHQVPTIHLK
jgi:hypothetical protein